MEIILLDENRHNLNLPHNTIEVNNVLSNYLKTECFSNSTNCLYIIHTSDSIWEEDTIKQIDEKYLDYGFTEYDNLMMLLDKFCETNRFIFFSGGTTSYRSSKNQYGFQNIIETEQFKQRIKKGFHWEALNIYQINNSLDWKKIHAAKITKELKISDFILDDDFLITIIALNILIQGYLAVQVPEFVFGGDSNSKAAAEKFIKENNLFPEPGKLDEARSKTSFDCLIRKTDNINDSKTYWFDVLKEEIEKIKSEAFQKEFNLSSESKLLTLWKIFRGNWLGKDELVQGVPTNQNDWTELLLSVHNECRKILNTGKKKV